MKKLVLSAFFVSSLLISAGTVTMAQTTASVVKITKKAKVAKGTAYKIDTNQSNMAWEGKKVTGQHNGTVKISQGDILVDKNKVTGGTVEIDLRTITDLDVTNAEFNQKLVGHLKSDDFFSVEKHPTATFKINKVAPIANAKAGAANYTVNGDLTIKGITKPVSFPAIVTVTGNTITAKSDAVVLNRTQWDIRYGSKSFFENIGDKAIYDDFTVQFNLVAKK